MTLHRPRSLLLSEASPLPGPAPPMMTAPLLGSRSNRPLVAGSCLEARDPLELVGHMLPDMRGPGGLMTLTIGS